MEMHQSRRAGRLWAALMALVVAAVGTGVAHGADGQQEFATRIECMNVTVKPCYPTDHGTFAPDMDPLAGGTINFDGEWLGQAGEAMAHNHSGTPQNPVVTVDMDQVSFPDVQPVLDPELGRVRVPIRFVSEKMGATVSWEDATKTVTIVRGDLTVILHVNDPVITINGQAKTIDAPPIITEGRTMVPLRAISEMFGATVDWVGDTPPAARLEWPGRYQVWIWVPWGYWGAAGMESRLQTDWFRRN